MLEQKEEKTEEIEKEKMVSGSRMELESLIIEYKNQFDRSNKLDNKVYIAITFCGFLFVFITGLFSGISQITRPSGGLETAVTFCYLLTCIAVMISYVYVLIYFMRLLQPEQIIRVDPDKLEKEKLDQLEEAQACCQLVLLYRKTVSGNLDKLKQRCDEFTKGLRFILPTVVLAFVAYTFQLILQVMR